MCPGHRIGAAGAYVRMSGSSGKELETACTIVLFIDQLPVRGQLLAWRRSSGVSATPRREHDSTGSGDYQTEHKREPERALSVEEIGNIGLPRFNS